ncbi:hypothetical protein Sme01_56310 [Sphaerisporangium melleum]|uniref:Uncharacterized protein n=1 Tax=Sphaerisporangium melleum TaxID=321316 RepID=A0A917RGT8_9ACTN|nr:hypothetical protein [Sphaerisporangium melleum]GGL05842.1 hypothetical protein GCM10007964_55120 [Sphaerisporangium melleum]GII73155.1 hypothetical protein Sme01_56310 [Sphaerisporangium melleum]
MVDSENSRNGDEDSQAAEPRGRLGDHPNGHREDRGGAEEAESGDERDERSPEDEHDGNAPGSGRSFLLGLAWWP